MIYVTPNWTAACNTLSDALWQRNIMGRCTPGTSRDIRNAKEALRQVERTEPPVNLGVAQ